MASVVHCLGDLEHIYDKYNLKLRTNGYITLSSLPSSDYPFPSNAQDLDALVSSGTWTAGAKRLLFHVELLFDDVAVSGSQVSQITEDIGFILCNSEAWSQLSLDSALTFSDSNKFLISLSAQPSNDAHIRPPRCIPSTCLNEIGMTFHFSTCRRTKDTSRPQAVVSGNGNQYTIGSTIPSREPLDWGYYSSFTSPEWPQGASSIDTSLVSSQSSVSSNTRSTSSLKTLGTRHTYTIQEVKLEMLVKLVDYSLRRMMSDCRSVRPGGVILSSDAGFPKLAATSPALFSPGYVKALSQRTGLLPTLAGIVSRVYCRSNSSRLRRKLEQLQDLSYSSYLDHDSIEDSHPSSATFVSFVEAKLWYLTWNKLIDPVACRGLKPLSISNRKGPGSHEMFDKSLDDAGDVMLDQDEASVFDANYDAMELDEDNHLDLFREPSLDETADEGKEPLNEDFS